MSHRARSFGKRAVKRLLALAWLLMASGALAQEGLRELRDATWMPDAANGRPDATRAAPVQLPDNLALRANPSWYRLVFTLPSIPAERQAVFFPRSYAQLELELNGHPLGSTGLLSTAPERGWKSTHLFPIPPEYLVAGENSLLMRAGGAGGWTFSPPRVGPLLRADADFTLRMIGTAIAPLAVGLMVALLGVFVLVLWVHRHAEPLYAYFGFASVLCGLHMAWWMLPNPPIPQPHNRILWLATYTFWVSLMTIFFVRYTGQPWRWFVRGMWTFALAGYPVLYVADHFGALSPTSLAWRAIGIFAVLVGLGIVTRHAWQRRRADSILLLITGLCATGFGIHDWWTGQSAAGLLSRVPLVPYAGLLFVLLFGWLLAERFNLNVAELAVANDSLSVRVVEKTRALEDNYRQLRDAERQQTILEERGRILRDMHDGLGTKLMISLRSLQRGDLDNHAAADLVRDCIDELRLTVDAYDQSDGDLAALLGNLRYRLGERLQQAGLAVEWQVTETPPVAALEGGGGRELMRIVQECLANILHHANATKVTFATQHIAHTGRVRVTVRDDGRGLAGKPDRGSGGHGLANMQLRAQRLGGELSLSSDDGGTCVAIDLPTGPGSAIPRPAG